MTPDRQNDIIKNNENSREQNDHQTPQIAHMGETGEISLNETGGDEDGYGGHQHLDATTPSPEKRLQTAIRAGEESSIAKHDARPPGNDDGGELKGAMEHHCQETLHEQPPSDEKHHKRAKHHTVEQKEEP